MRILCVAVVLTSFLAACGGGPFMMIPGGELSGEIVNEPVSDWSFVDDDLMDLETRPDDPYSVELYYIMREGKLYIDASEGRNWLEHIRADSHVRVRLADKIYLLNAVLIDQPGELEGFDADGFIYRLDPR